MSESQHPSTLPGEPGGLAIQPGLLVELGWLRAPASGDMLLRMKSTEIIFLVEEASEGGFIARALGESIFTEAESLDELRSNVRDAVSCHYSSGDGPAMIRLHFVRDEVFTA